MNYLILHYFFMVYICNRKITAYSYRRANYDVDDFIKQLLVSQKFEELAEKIADKAVKKIKNMEDERFLIEKAINYNNVKEDDLQHRYLEKKREYDEKEMPYKDRAQRTSNVENNKPGTIIEDIMKKEKDSSQSNNLILKYEYLKQQAMEKKASTQNTENQNVERFASEEHSPIWRNIENSSEYHKKRPTIEERAQEPIQIYPTKRDSDEKEERNPNYVKKNEPRSNYEKDRESYNDRENFKNRFFDEHEREQNAAQGLRNERYQDDILDRDINTRPQFKSDDTKSLQNEKEDGLSVMIDLDDNEAPKSTTGWPKKVFKEIADPQNIAKTEIQNEDLELEQHKIGENENIFAEDQKMVNGNSDEDDSFRSPDENGITSGYGANDTNKTRIIRREGNRFYTYLSAPEYAEYHEELAKQQAKNPNNQFDII